MRVSLAASPAQSQQTRHQLANPEDSLSYELGKAVQELPPVYTRVLAGSISVLVLGTINWAHFSEVEEVANATGKIVPSTEVRPFRAPSVGTITRINVKPGMTVEKGQTLMEIDPGATETNVDSLKQDAKKIQEDIQRLEAESQGQGATGNALQDQLTASRQREFIDKQNAAIAEANRQNATIGEAQARLERFQENLVNARATLTNATASKADARKNLEIAQERQRRLKTLEDSGAVPHLELLNAAAQVTQASQQLTSAINQINEAEGQITSLEREIEAQQQRINQARQAFESARSTAQGLTPQRQSEILTQLKQRREELTKKQGEIAVATQQRKDRESITAPFAGIIYNLKATEGLVQQGEELLSLLPKDRDLVLEVKVSNQDIGFVRPGMKAKVKLATFPYQEFGVIEGELISISPDAVVERDENGRELGPVFPAKVRLDRNAIPVRGRNVELSPGMAGTADIVTRKRSILSFLVEPITRRFSEAFSVR
ncbi:HlyD family efflux transporter periplasmic adaptor subunit [Cyanobacteria bacterium FACHB-DQ100]|uniref:HlyD family efflux transporter periplasmic adaptor subunit n=1 Tax=unclassified Leptolyngbya TaxID=2650499 RepID=UPI00168064BF|nr:HlyD family efflux transporter periplasmic adaptor subunit [Leptolyngbya sp. FACHB-17]MBD1823335.1 HlyD family efflux transporter periplasmic adaptor subunit [Cyanobacteria bacterium FACHB-DQ100]MBD2083225.1 HlyD family efflux transporter periplasmic adaptor subunit [Leptolyngbya sp. FACHB-17]